jgi:hypothetical protein
MLVIGKRTQPILTEEAEEKEVPAKSISHWCSPHRHRYPSLTFPSFGKQHCAMILLAFAHDVQLACRCGVKAVLAVLEHCIALAVHIRQIAELT